MERSLLGWISEARQAGAVLQRHGVDEAVGKALAALSIGLWLEQLLRHLHRDHATGGVNNAASTLLCWRCVLLLRLHGVSVCRAQQILRTLDILDVLVDEVVAVVAASC